MELMLCVFGGFVMGFAVTSLMQLPSLEDDCGECPYKINYIESITESGEEK